MTGVQTCALPIYDIFENDFFEDIRQKLEESSIEVVDVDDIEEMDDIEGKINIEEDGETENLDSMEGFPLNSF